MIPQILTKAREFEGEGKTSIMVDYPKRVKPVSIKKILPYMENRGSHHTFHHNVQRMKIGQKHQDVIAADAYGGAVLPTSLFQLSNVAKVKAMGDWYSSPKNAVLFEIEVEGTEVSLKPYFSEPLLTPILFVFTYRKEEEGEKPALECVFYDLKDENEDDDWILGVPTYSEINNSVWKYVTASSISQQGFMRRARFSNELVDDHEIMSKQIIGTLEEDGGVYEVQTHTMNTHVLQKATIDS